MKKFRVIYEVTVTYYSGEFDFRAYARNMKAARKIARRAYRDQYATIKRMPKCEYCFVPEERVEG